MYAKYIILIIGFVDVLSLHPAFGQDMQSNMTQASFDLIKAEIAQLMKENNKLSGENESLLKEYHQLKDQIQEAQGDITQMKNYAQESLSKRSVKQVTLTTLKDEIARIEGEIAIIESRKSYMSGELIDVDDQKRLWALELADLQYQKRDLEMRLKLRQYDASEEERKYNAQLSALKNELTRSMEKERELQDQINELQTQSVDYPEKISELQTQVDELQSQVTLIESKRNFKVKENEHLDNKKLLIEKSIESIVQGKIKEKSLIEEIVNDLEIQYKTLEEKLKASEGSLQKNREITDSVMKLDEENRALQENILELKEKMNHK